MWTGFVYRDGSDAVSREGWVEKWSAFSDYEWIFTEATPSGACIILTTQRLKDEPETPTEWQTPPNSCTIS